jgi:hypothetical protein
MSASMAWRKKWLTLAGVELVGGNLGGTGVVMTQILGGEVRRQPIFGNFCRSCSGIDWVCCYTF